MSAFHPLLRYSFALNRGPKHIYRSYLSRIVNNKAAGELPLIDGAGATGDPASKFRLTLDI